MLCYYDTVFGDGLVILRRSRFSRVRLVADTLVDLVPVLLISQMNLKVSGGHLRARGVQLSGTIGAPDPRQEHPLHVLGCWLARLDLWRRDDDDLGVSVNSAVSHRRFKRIMVPGLSQIGKSVH